MAFFMENPNLKWMTMGTPMTSEMGSVQCPGDLWGILKGSKSWFYNHGYEKSIQVDTIATIDINQIFGARIATNRLDSTSTWLKVPPTRNPPILDVT